MPPWVSQAPVRTRRCATGSRSHGRERLFEGDVVVCNHAAVQGQHLNNTGPCICLSMRPRPKMLIGFFAINVHWIDIGGVPSGHTTDIFI